MNRSGVAVSLVKKFYKIPVDNIFVFHDELDLKFCQIKCKVGGGDAGHNGIKSIQEAIGRDFFRIRVGIGRPEFKDEVTDFVLKKFNKEEMRLIDNLICEIANDIELLLGDTKDEFLRRISCIMIP
jgi:PTH1 family peptidyl-tRNA hydrolase